MEQILEVRDVAPAIRVLCLNRPDVRNALSVELRDCVSAAIAEASADKGVSAVVLTAAGSTFSAGFDLREFERAAADASFNTVLWASSDRFHHSVLRCNVPVICALNGPALAGGFDLVTLCDLRIAQPGVWFQRPEIEWGVPLYGPLRDLVGGSVARELCLTNRRIELDEAVRIGLVNEVAQASAFDRAIELARQIAGRPAESVRRTKSKFTLTANIAAHATLEL